MIMGSLKRVEPWLRCVVTFLQLGSMPRTAYAIAQWMVYCIVCCSAQLEYFVTRVVLFKA
jgi:hypothetical protein